MGQFDDSVDEAVGGTVLEPSPQLDPIGQQAVPPPDVTPILASMPKLPAPPPTPPPPTNLPLTPKQRLMALFATSFALGAGPHSGMGMGALEGLAAERKQQQQQAMQQWAFQAKNNQAQQEEYQHQQSELDRQRALKLTTTFDNFRKDLQKVQETGTEDDYRKLVGLYSGGLQAAGYRVPPEYFYQNFRFTPPTDQQQIQSALTKYFASPLVKELVKTDPNKAYAGAITYTSNSDGQKQAVRLSVADAMKALGQDINVAQGEPLFSTQGTGSEMQQAIASARSEFTARFGKPPSQSVPSDNDWVMNRAKALTQRPEKSNPLAGAGTTTMSQDAVDYAASQVRILGNGAGVMTRLNDDDRKRILNAVAAQAKALGQTPAQAIQKQAAFKADAGSLAQMTKLKSGAESFESKALAQADIVSNLSNKVSRSQMTAINNAIVQGKIQLLGDTDAQLFAHAVQTFATEYAKIMEGATSSVAGASVGAQNASQRLINAALNKGQIKGTVELMKKEMALTIMGYDSTIAHITERMGGGGGGGPQKPEDDGFKIQVGR